MNRSNSGASFDIIHILLDIGSIAVALFITYTMFGKDGFHNRDLKVLIPVYLVSVLVFILFNRSLNVYNTTLFFYPDRILRRESLAYIISLICAYGLLYHSFDLYIENKMVVTLPIITYVMIIIEIMFFRGIVDRFIMRRHIPRALYVGSKDSYNKFRYFLEKTTVQINEIGYISFDDDDKSIEYIGKLKDLESIIRKYNIDEVYILQKRDMDIKQLQQYVDICIEMGVTCRIIVDTFRRRKAFSFVSSIGTYPILTYHTVTMNRYAEIFKRWFDIIFSILVIIITSPIMLITAIAIKIDSPGPVFFRQVRIGKNGRHFLIWKFRSMRVDAESMIPELAKYNDVKDGMMFKMKEDPRVTRVGKFIRKTSIDELPQFFNVLFGSMSVVGTRPPTIREVELYSMHDWRRISIKPGITGMWQVSGRSSVTDFNKVVELDTDYIDKWSIWLDIKIIIKTVVELFKYNNSY
ncbi:sugar transferase [Butyrivibrio sp. WCD3002]|uniref:sugar transferase n=1 Tax=Butyrivibrio sp. WCD3002 TaxID=1280676 RepID=UPI00040AE634|nr:sugar transferase [Butyrivibrio sp. WCD3002]